MKNRSIEESVLDVIEEVLGLEKEDMKDNMDMNIIEAEIIDSLSSASIIIHLEKSLGITIDPNQIKTEDFTSINSIIETIKRIVG